MPLYIMYDRHRILIPLFKITINCHLHICLLLQQCVFLFHFPNRRNKIKYKNNVDI